MIRTGLLQFTNMTSLWNFCDRLEDLGDQFSFDHAYEDPVPNELMFLDWDVKDTPHLIDLLKQYGGRVVHSAGRPNQ